MGSFRDYYDALYLLSSHLRETDQETNWEGWAVLLHAMRYINDRITEILGK